MKKQAACKVSTTCPYCGVGCGVQATIQGDNLMATKGDHRHPANFGRLCIKGSKLPETGGHEGRLLYPRVAGKQVSWDEAIQGTTEKLQKIIQQHGPDSLAFYLSGQLLTEDYYVANKLIKGFIGSSHVDTNSRLCMASTVAGHKRAFGEDLVPGCYEDLELADLLVLVGSNAAWNHPVLYQRIQAAKQERPELKVVVVDPRRTATCDLADLHLAIKPGGDVLLFNALLVHLAENKQLDHEFVSSSTDNFKATLLTALEDASDLKAVAGKLDIPEDQLATFFDWFTETPKTVSLFSQGVNQSSSGTDKVNALINCHLATGRVGKPGSTPFSLTGQPNAMGGREVGGLANQLAAHMGFSAEEVEKVERFWQAPNICRKEGFKAVELFQAIHRGDIKAVWIMGTNPLVSLPDSQFVREALQKCELVIVSEAMAETDTLEFADIAFPATTWAEKDGTVTNSERRISRQRGFLPPPGEARHDWQIICQIARQLGYNQAFNYQCPAEIFREHAELSGFENQDERCFNISGLSQLTNQAYENLQPVQWPVNSSNPLGSERLFTQGHFFTASKRAQFVSVQSKPVQQKLEAAYPFRLNTGRIRDQWHTMTRTGRSAQLMQHRSEPFVEIHPLDAKDLQLQDRELVCVSNTLGEYIAPLKITEHQRRGELFLPMHWNRQFTAKGLCNQLIEQVYDPISGQPESKQGRGHIRSLQAVWQARLVVRNPLATQPDTDYWVERPLTNSHCYHLASRKPVESWFDWCQQHLGNHPKIQLESSQVKTYRAASFKDDQLEWVLLVSPANDFPSLQELDQKFAQLSLSPQERQLLLKNKEDATQGDEQVVCSCFQVSEGAIRSAIQQGKDSPESLGKALSCGTNCGSCLPEIKSLIEQEVSHDITELV